MANFIRSVLLDLKKKDVDFSKLQFILPSKRSGLVLQNEICRLNNTTFFAPSILSIEEFVEELSNLKALSYI